MGNNMSVDMTSEFFKKEINHPASQIEKNYGLRYSVYYLNEIKENIPLMSIEEVSEFVDYITWTNSNNENWIRNQLAMPTQIDNNDNNDNNYINTSSFGNMAYLHSHAPTEELKILAKKKYDKMILKEYSKILN